MAVNQLGGVAHRVRGMMCCPQAYRLREDSGESTTSNPSVVKKVCQKGRFSYIFSAIGSRSARGGFSPPRRERRYSYFHLYRLGIFLLFPLPSGRSQRLPETKRRRLPAEGVDGELAVVAAQPALAGLRGVFETLQLVRRQQAALFPDGRSLAARAAP